ncbi:bifunctional DNA-formamidopyrimidine glycosylase/DNA-(apurinic or apyrimidinic site) lyase [Maridesulfovibrio hydrothermalis]|uniref:Formamidopyrimidine-DNA glycosylase n=1 Tax=Maridesulfovibrio hydrothermalis AM13 = DSM 14728 TaxID=1121451 RepID=L0R886_9BACT|nr:bifunctional DNA-formamidopyrimidine glycosylase/DNA-(apurinic or apyrimidinic site) lyase [Maridesulfovibrio hydrothermalis]CCO22968.1 Formamidopyrimidine-DNA glycosylase [Maridesulfovibrio hydrothermalis AM13 = DSM 14728]
MPELPEVEVISRGLSEALVGKTIESVKILNHSSVKMPWYLFSSRVAGEEITRVHRRAKLLIMDLGEDLHITFHLKMTGRVLAHEGATSPDTHTRLVFGLADGGSIEFHDTRKFGEVRALNNEELQDWDFYRNLGPEPLETTAAALAERIEGRKAQIKGLLLNQSVVAGVGNIYADESLFRSGIHPKAKASDLSKDSLEKLFSEVQSVLKQAISENGSSIRDYVDAGGDAGGFQNSFKVYGKKGEPCPDCGHIFEGATVAGRSTTFCSKCQKLED